MSFTDELRIISHDAKENETLRKKKALESEFEDEISIFLCKCKEAAKRGRHECVYECGIREDDEENIRRYLWEPAKAEKFVLYAKKIEHTEYGFSDVSMKVRCVGGIFMPERASVVLKVKL